ncbi:MAG: hypothetical protein C0514_07225 [Candidatus Puniceispirillum sp.]|nr:hypothetical protein [Candidatus Puniceispirillum sp.]
MPEACQVRRVKQKKAGGDTLVIKIGDGFPFAPTRRAAPRKADKASAGSFSSALDETTTQETSASAHVSASAPLQPLMHLQEITDSLHTKSRAISRGEDLLVSLEVLRDGLLMGSFSQQNLEDIASQLAHCPVDNIEEPLKDILEQIEQRVHIELTKIEMSLKGHEDHKQAL